MFLLHSKVDYYPKIMNLASIDIQNNLSRFAYYLL